MRISTLVSVILLACLSQAALADDLSTATPSPTPAYINPLGRRGDIRRAERIARQNDRQSTAGSRAQARAKQEAERAAEATAQERARQAARAREQAQREVAAQNRRETRNEKPQLTSDLMSRMGFSEKEIADQKAKEQATGAKSKETPAATSR